MLDNLLTEGARRAAATSAILAARNGASEREPLHLLWALMLDESHAQETLKRSGVTRERLQAISRLAVPSDAVDMVGAGNSPGEGPTIPQSDELRRVMAAAARTASWRGRDAEVGTDDLLAALVAVESDASRVLARLGVDSESLGRTADASGPLLPIGNRGAGGLRSPDPIEIDFTIRWWEASEEGKTDALRIIDAAANRAREGLRVLEDYARFGLDDGHLTGRLKECRHALREALSALPPAALLRSRETQADVGTQITTPAETVRESPVDVAQAAFKRTQEAVRSLEEFGKLWSVDAARVLERLRYGLYTLEKALLLTEFNRRELAERRLYLLATESQCHHGSGPAIRGALAGGVGVVQVREKEMPERKLIEHARRVRAWTREAGALCIMNDRVDLAVVTECDGIHLGQDDLLVKEARAIVGPHRLVGVSTHTIEQARQAVLDGADYIGVGPVFPSSTKSFDSLAGLELIGSVAAEITLPWFAIGGINARNVDAVLEAGARRIAVSHAISSAEDPQSAAHGLSQRLANGAAAH